MNTSAPKQVALYARVSTKGLGQDPEGQLISLREYAERRVLSPGPTAGTGLLAGLARCPPSSLFAGFSAPRFRGNDSRIVARIVGVGE